MNELQQHDAVVRIFTGTDMIVIILLLSLVSVLCVILLHPYHWMVLEFLSKGQCMVLTCTVILAYVCSKSKNEGEIVVSSGDCMKIES